MHSPATSWVIAFSALTVALLNGCCTTSAREPRANESASARPEHSLPSSILWFRDSAERKAAYSQAYALAWLLVEQRLTSSGPLDRPKLGHWAVVLDADETILDNLEYQVHQAQEGVGFDSKSWAGWVARESAPAFPPAVQFIAKVRQHGGRVVIVTNRAEPQCQATRATLSRDAVEFDAILCANGAQNSKEQRFTRITSPPGIHGFGPLEILLYIGDSISDCRGQSQRVFNEALFGTRCIILPNPMYGTWMKADEDSRD